MEQRDFDSVSEREAEEEASMEREAAPVVAYGCGGGLLCTEAFPTYTAILPLPRSAYGCVWRRLYCCVCLVGNQGVVSYELVFWWTEAYLYFATGNGIFGSGVALALAGGDSELRRHRIVIVRWAGRLGRISENLELIWQSCWRIGAFLSVMIVCGKEETHVSPTKPRTRME